MPGSIRALRRQTDPVRGVGRIPIAKRRTVGRPQYRETGTDTLSRQEEAIADAIEDAYASIPRETLLEAVERGDAAGYARTVLGYLTAASSGIEEVLLESFVSSGETSAIDLGRELSRQYRAVGKAETPSPSQVALRFRFNALDPRTTTWARNEAGRLITNMATSEQEMFRRLVTQSFTEGRTPQSTASSIFGQLRTVTPSPNAREFAEALGGNLNGLTERYERAVMNRVATVADDLAARGITGTKALERMRREGDKYATKLRRARSRTIARTERMRAHNEARLLSYQQAIDDGLMSREHSRKVWSTGPFDVCPICVGMAGTEAKMSEPFTLPNGAQVQSPPAHPNCRCTLQTRTDTTLYDPPQSLGTGVPGDPYRIGGRGVSDEGRKLDSPLTDTQRIHTVTRNGKSAYKPERIRQVHDPWIRESLDGGVVHGDTQVTFMGGGSGAGKGSIQRSGDVTFRRGTTVVDSDEAKKATPEHRELPDAGDNKAAAYVHEESSDMAQRLMAESIDRGYDTVLDGTGDSTFEKMAGKVARARQQGAQRVKAEYVTIDTDEALRRAAQRAARSGREVPEDVVTGTHEAVSKIFPKLADADTFDELRLWDNMGDTPELIYEKIDGVERVLNRERYEAFLRKDPNYIPGSRQPLATPPATADDIIYGTNDTQGVYTEVVDGQRRYTAARTESVHRPWLDDLLSAGEASDEPTMTFLGGGSGAGKGTITNPDKGGVVQFRRGTITVDSDEAKKAIPEYRKLVADDDPIAAAFVHEESSDMAAQALAESLERGFDTVLDGTGDSSIEKLASKVAKAREQGAKRVTAEYVTIDIDDALARAASRAKRTGREVPEDVIRGTHESVSRVLPEAIKRDLFDEVRLWDNTGIPPELIYEKIGGVERILNPQRWEAFLRKNSDYVPAAGPRTIRNMAALRTRAGRIRDSLTISRNKKNVGMVAEELENAGLIVRRDLGPGRGTHKLPEFGKPGSRTNRRQAYAKSVLDLRLTDEGEDAISALLEAGRSARKIIDDELDRVARAPLAERAELAARKEAIRVERTDIEQRVRRQVNATVERNFDEVYQDILDPEDVRRFGDIIKFADDDGFGTSAFFDEWYEYAVRKYGDDPRFIDWWLRTFDDPTDQQFLFTKKRIEAGKNLADAGASYRGWLIDLYRKTDRAVKNDSVREGALRELNDEIRDLTRRVMEIDEQLAAQRFEVIQEVLAENRPEFGTGDALAAFDRSKIRGKSGVKKAEVIAEIEQYGKQVPREWLDDYLTGHSFGFIQRGYFSRYKRNVRVSGSKWRSTLTHEMTHGHQYYTPQINAAERLYLSRRAQSLGDEAFRPKTYRRDTEPFFDLGTGDDYTTKVYFDGITELSTRSSEFTWHPAQARPLVGGTASEPDQELVEFWLGALLTL